MSDVCAGVSRRWLQACGPSAMVTGQTMAGFLLQLLTHCRPVHDILLDELEEKKMRYLRDLLFYIKHCAENLKSCSQLSFRSATACEQVTVEEMKSRVKNYRGKNLKCQSLVLLLMLYSSDITCHAVIAGGTVSVVGKTSSIVLQYRLNTHLWRDGIKCRVSNNLNV